MCVPPISTAAVRLMHAIITDPSHSSSKSATKDVEIRSSVDSYLSPCYYHFVNSSQNATRLHQEVRRLSRWFLPGMGVKRWMFLILGGITLLGSGLAIFLYDF